MDSFVSSIYDFYRDSEILITGGTGFIGKVVIERLFATCPNFKRIYLILRERKGVPVQSRIKEFKECDVSVSSQSVGTMLCSFQLFEDILKDNPHAFDKITIVQGDASLPGLGLSEIDRKVLLNVNVVFHCAASVRFNESLKVSAFTTPAQICTCLFGRKQFC